MKSIGQVIKENRIKRKFSRAKVESVTKIRRAFIEAIESESWDKLPDYTVVVGFVKRIASALSVDQSMLVALLRRDYKKSKEVRFAPKPDIKEKFIWSPKLTFVLGTFFFSILVICYLIFQYFSFIRPPKLVVSNPPENATLNSKTVKVTGRVDSDSTVVVNNKPAFVNDNGTFEVVIDLDDNDQAILVVAKSRAGKETVISRKINLELKK